MRQLLSRLRAARWLPYAAIAALALAYTATHINEHEAFSPFDEYVYLDYVAQVPDGGVQSGAEVGEEARNEVSCRGVQGYGEFGERCDAGTHDDDAAYPYGGGTGADIYAPPYFALTWVIAQPLRLLGLDLMDAARCVGGIWLAAGLALCLGLMRSFGVGRWLAFGVVASLLALPAVYWSSQYISTDAPTLAIGGTIGLLAVRAAQGRQPWLLILASAVAVLFKVQNLAIVGIAALSLIIVDRLGERRRREDPSPPTRSYRSMWWAVAAVVAAVSAQAIWLVVRRLSAVGEAANVDTTMSVITVRAVAEEALKFLRTLGETGVPVSTWSTVAAWIFAIVAVAALAIVLVRGPKNQAGRWSVALATVLVAIAYGPALAVATSIIVGHYIPLPTRYGIVLIPAIAICIAFAVSLSGSRIRTVVAVVGAVVGVASVVLV